MTLATKPPTIQDVARHAGVSTATVSRALSAPERVSDDTRERILMSIAETGYTLNAAARSLRRQRARAIVVALPNAGNPYYSTILDAVVSEAGERSYGVLVANRQPQDATAYLRDYFLSSRADGLLVFDATIDTAALARLMAEHGNLPIVVMCDEMIEDHFNLVTSDNRAAAGRAVQHLVALGHTRIGVITGPVIAPYPNERTLGFLEAMAQNGLPVPETWILPGDHQISSGFDAGSRFAALKARPTAIVSANDQMAIGFISRIQQAGFDCPGDVSVVGFDDIEMTQYISPGLTTMRQKRSDLGRVSTGGLIDLIEGVRSPDDRIREVLRCELVVRGSTAAVRGDAR